MCGICCIMGNFSGIKYVLNGIKMLLNRGYDSTGVCGIDKKNNFILHKYAKTETIDALELLKQHKSDFSELVCPLIAHSRWATCGSNTNANAHPHIDWTSRFSLVHNGIIENHNEIRKKYLNNIILKSQTDSEIIVNLISVMYDFHQNIEIAITKTVKQLRGSWALSIISTIEPNKMYCICNGSPLLLGYNKNCMMIVSEKNGFHHSIDEYVVINDNDLIVLEKKNDKIKFNKKINYIPRKLSRENIQLTPYPFTHWTKKEIYEQYESSIRALCNYSRIKDNSSVQLHELDINNKKLVNTHNLILLGCGTSYHAGLYASNMFKKISGLNTVQVFDGAEFCDDDIPHSGNTTVVFISQSGETRDLYQCIEIAKRNKLCTIGIINVSDSLISRSMDYNIYLNCGIEMAVASTKAFTNQVIVLSLLAVWFSQIKNIHIEERTNILNSLKKLPIDIKNTIDIVLSSAELIAKQIYNLSSVFIIGKGSSEIIAKEGSLKIKEIGYIHSEAYNSSSLKHGPFSLLVNNIPVIMIALDDYNFNKNMGVAEEVLARNSIVFGISDVELDNRFAYKIMIPKNEVFGGLLANIPLQIIAYDVALFKKVDPDRPKNLAKVITV